MQKIYLASSWRNPYHGYVLNELKSVGYEVYDFKNPAPGVSGFSWSQIDEDWKHWSNAGYISALQTIIANNGYSNDFNAMNDADTCVLLLPCGRSAHSEAGYMKGAGKNVYVVLDGAGQEPELMYKMYDWIFEDIPAFVIQARKWKEKK